MPSLFRFFSPALVLLLCACDSQDLDFSKPEEAEHLSGGATSVRQSDHNAFSLPAANLSPMRRLDFSVGNSFFRNPWVMAPSTTTARDGLGPLFNTNACQNCHIKDGRGQPPGADAEHAVSMLVRVSIANDGSAEHQKLLSKVGVVPEPNYGTQIQDMSLPGITPEAKIRVNYQTHIVTLKDGLQVELRKPQLELSQLGYGPLHEQALLSARIAPPMIGLGLLEAIDEHDILANADPEDSNGDGIRGTPNWVWDSATQTTQLGRFGWKAGQPDLNQQNAHAFASDMGLTSSLVPTNDCTNTQSQCLEHINGGDPEVTDAVLANVLFYTRTLAVPMRRDIDQQQVLLGKKIFHQAGCAACHTPSFTTSANAAEPELAKQTIRPYSDLLLHDMGEGLADQRDEFQANGRQWRTAPLWGIGLTQAVSGHTQLLHDGRARNLLEAILWHGGEAQAARQAVIALNTREREALLSFLNSL